LNGGRATLSHLAVPGFIAHSWAGIRDGFDNEFMVRLDDDKTTFPPTTSAANQLSFGIEVCSTNGQDATWTINDYSITTK
jgi:hypothetical protein